MNSLPKTVTRQRHDCDLNPGLSAPESSTLTTQLPNRTYYITYRKYPYSLVPYNMHSYMCTPTCFTRENKAVKDL